ncbi:MAG: adenosine kinase [Myxococcota bacterium]
MSTSTRHDIAGLGNAIVDALVRIEDDSILDEYSLPRGHSYPIPHNQWETMFERLKSQHPDIQSGGSCANSICALGLMGANAIYCGQVGDDELGKLYTRSVQDACGQHAIRVSDTLPTGKCLSLISASDAERTMLTDLSAAIHLPGLGDFKETIHNSRILHLTGYLLLGDPMLSRAMEAIQIAKAAGIPVSIDAADPFVVETLGEKMWDILTEHADIVFLNAHEATALCGTNTPEAAFNEIAPRIQTTIVKLGKDGSLVGHDGKTVRVQAHVVNAVDTTGAGDAYAAGFLYGMLNGWPLENAGDLGSRVAALTVAQIGAVVRDRDRLAEAVAAAAPRDA